MNILIADKLSPAVIDSLRAAGDVVDYQPDLSADDLATAAGNAEVLVVRSTRVTDATIAAAGKLVLIVRAGAGVNTIDLATASARGVYVTNCPGKNTAAVAELAIGLMISADRRIADATAAMRNGEWRKKEFGRANGLHGRTLGILGFGMIGQAVAAGAKGLGMKVVAWSRSLNDKRAAAFGVECAPTPQSLAAEADVISIHLAAGSETRHLVSRDVLQAMKPGAILVNTARGEVVDTEALREAITDRALRVALDVYEDEPSGGEASFADTELAARVTATPHIGASTEQASEAIAAEVVRIISEYRSTGQPPNVVNVRDQSPAQHSLVVRHYNRVGVLAAVLDALKREDINVEEMQNRIFDGGQTACCALRVDRAPSQDILTSLHSHADILQVSAEA